MKLNKINLSGVSYDIEDLNAAKTVELTQAEYDALTVKDPNTFYVITDAQAADLSNFYTKSETDDLLDTKLDASAYTPTDLSNYYTKSETSGATEISTALASKADTATTYTKTEVDTALGAKQDTLVSGTNIKTVNNESLLGEGNITIEGGGGMDDDTQQLISTALNDLNDRKADKTELSKYQKKGDYVETPTLADYMTNDAFDEYATAKERIISGALNDLNNKFGGLRLVKISQADYDALTEKDENTLYIINNVI